MRLMDNAGFDVDNFILEVQKGDIVGASIMWAAGHNTEVTVAQGSMWNPGGLYPYNIGYGADADYITATSSLGVADSGVELQVNGLDSEGNILRDTLTLNASGIGTTTKKFSRFFVGYTKGSIDFTGTITLSNSLAAIVASVLVLEQRSMVCNRTIPKGYSGYLIGGYISTGSGKEGIGSIALRLGNKGISKGSSGFMIGEKLMVFENTIPLDRPFIRIPELTDVEIRVYVTSTTVSMSGGFGLVLLDNSIYGSQTATLT